MAGTTLSKAIRTVLFDEITVGIKVPVAAELAGISDRTLHNWCEGVCSPPLDKLLHLVRVISAEDPPRGLRLWDRISALVAMQARPAPTAIPAAPIPALVLGVSAAEGEVSAWAADSLADGTVTTYEASKGRPVLRSMRHKLDTLDAAVAGLEESGPQRALAMGSR